MNKKLVAFIIFFGLFQFAYAQEQQCVESLNQARDDFNAGHLEGIASILHDCINNGFSKEQKIEAYRILTITYLYLEDPFGAEQSFLALLAIEPEFRVSPTDPVELEYLSNQYITTPIISYSAKLGANFSTVTVLHTNTVGNANDLHETYNVGLGINALGAIDVHFNKVVSLAVELQFSSNSFDYELVLWPERDNHKINETRTNLYGSLPVAIKFTYPGRVYYPYVYGGYSPSYGFSSNSSVTRDPQTEAEVKNTSLNLNPETPQFSHSLIFGAGLKRRIGYKFVMIDLRYRLGMTNMVNSDSQFDFTNEDIRIRQFRQLVTSDDFRWNGFEVAIGFVWPMYKPRAKNELTLQTLVKKWFGKKKKGNE